MLTDGSPWLLASDQFRNGDTSECDYDPLPILQRFQKTGERPPNLRGGERSHEPREAPSPSRNNEKAAVLKVRPSGSPSHLVARWGGVGGGVLRWSPKTFGEADGFGSVTKTFRGSNPERNFRPRN